MWEIKITIEAPELAKALNNLASAMAGRQIQHLDPTITPAKSEPPKEVSSKTDTPLKPIEKSKATAPIPVSVPVAQPAKYTIEQITQAGSVMMDKGKSAELVKLLNSFGVQAITYLKPEQYGAFVTAMREIGARI